MTKAADKAGWRHRFEELIGASAFLVSLASIAIAYQETRASKQLVQASSLPYLTFSTTFDHTGDAKTGTSRTEVIRAIENNGVGPADVRYATTRYEGRNYGDSAKLLRDCCGITQLHTSATLTNRMIRPGVAVTFLDVQGKPVEEASIQRYADLLGSNAIQTIICYCSVFNDCWLLKSNGIGRPTPVRECPIVGPNESTL
jgi:hypothetical protein